MKSIIFATLFALVAAAPAPKYKEPVPYTTPVVYTTPSPTPYDYKTKESEEKRGITVLNVVPRATPSVPKPAKRAPKYRHAPKYFVHGPTKRTPQVDTSEVTGVVSEVDSLIPETGAVDGVKRSAQLDTSDLTSGVVPSTDDLVPEVGSLEGVKRSAWLGTGEVTGGLVPTVPTPEDVNSLEEAPGMSNVIAVAEELPPVPTLASSSS